MWITLLPLLTVAPPDLTLGRLAPPHGVEAWQGTESTDGVVRRSSSRADPQGRSLSDLAGQVVLLYWVESDRERLSLVSDLLRCNTDRRLTVLGLASPADAAMARELLSDHGLQHPIGLVERDGTPYGGQPMAVVGRTGELLWSGDPGREESSLLKVLTAALDRWPAPRVERVLGPQLDKALASYYAGDWAKAYKSTGKARSKAPEEAGYLLELLDEHERELLGRIPALAGSLRHGELALLDRALQRGWPKSAAALACRQQAKDAIKQLGASTYLDAEVWAGLQDLRPVLFPARKDSAGKRFAKKLGALARNSNVTDLTRRVKAMLAEFEQR
jgi:hypothetical protein